MEEENNNPNSPEEDQENTNEETPASEESTTPDDNEDDYESGEATVKSVSIKWGIILGIVSIAVFILGIVIV